MHCLLLCCSGVGGETGWGHIGPHIQSAVDTFSALLDAGLANLAKMRTEDMSKRLSVASEVEAVKSDDEHSESMTNDQDQSTVGGDNKSSVAADESDSSSSSDSDTEHS